MNSLIYQLSINQDDRSIFKIETLAGIKMEMKIKISNFEVIINQKEGENCKLC